MGTKFSELSERVGRDHKQIKIYPTMDDLDTLDDFKLFHYYRFLRSPENPEEQEIMTRIVTMFISMRIRLEKEE